jgi:Aldehyde dehydrogenase family
LLLLQLEVGPGTGGWQLHCDEGAARLRTLQSPAAMLACYVFALCSQVRVDHQVASETPLSALYLGRLAQEAGFPPGVINLIVVRLYLYVV